MRVRQRISRSAQVVLLRNGCVCCSVRADLGRVLKSQLRSPEPTKFWSFLGWLGLEFESTRPAFDAVVIETTGVAQPSPIIQLFFADPEIRRRARLDAVLTVVDAKHMWQHLRIGPDGKVELTGRSEVVQQVSNI